MIVEKIIQKSSRDVLIQFNNNDILILSLDVFLKSSLKKNDEISASRLTSLITENKKFHIKQRAFRLLGRRQHSVLELKLKLFQKDYEPKLVDEVLSDLTLEGYLDDLKFASMFVGEKLRTKSWGERRLRAELLKKGIENRIISDVLKSQLNEADKILNAEMLAQKKMKTLKNRTKDKLKLKMKLNSFLSSRGYDYEIIRKVSDKLIWGTDQDD